MLWCLPDLEPVGPLIPAGDRALLATTSTELVCLEAPPVDRASLTEAALTVAPPASRPGEGDGVVLADGTRLAGAVELEPDGTVRVTFSEDEVLTLEARRVALVELEGAAELRGEEFPVYRAWADALQADAVDELLGLFQSYEQPDLLGDCRRLLEEARERGLAPERAQELEARLVARNQSDATNAPLQRRRIAKEERAAREALRGAFLAASTWCAERGLPGAATVLLQDADGVLPDPETTLARAAALVPDTFPWRDEEGAAERWLTWAPEILPAGARFLGADDPEWARVADTTWTADTLGFATRNLVLFTKTDDPAVVGSCLRNGEGAVRTLAGLVGRAEGADRPLEVRLHATREAYLQEQTPRGTFAMPWSAGYYSPSERVSRFHVPDPDRAEPLARELHRVLAHELTHQYLSERWLHAERSFFGDPSQPGVWVVEGIARFLEDQIVELGRRGAGLDDARVKSLDTSARALEHGILLPVETLVEMPQAGFRELGGEPLAQVQLRNTLLRFRPSQRSLFYEQSGSLVFFLMNRRGEEGRARLVEYLRDRYRRRTPREGWVALGWESAEALERDFHAFLESLN